MPADAVRTTARPSWVVYAVGLGAGLVWSLGALASRSTDGISAWQYLLWRSIAVFVVMEVGGRVRGRGSTVKRAYTEGPLMLGATFSLLLASIGFVYALKNTSAANAAFLGSLSPLIAVVLARVFLRERLTSVTIGAIALSLVGLIIMATGPGNGGGNLRGNVGAISSAFGFASYTLCLRRDPLRNWDPVMPGYAVLMIALTATISTVQGRTLLPHWRDIALAMLHGGVLITLGTTMFNYASKSLSAVTMTVFSQSEMIGVPLWVFLFLDEAPKRRELIGGALILTAIVGKALIDARSASGSADSIGSADHETRIQPGEADRHQPPHPV